jgi:hypothetical protein
VSRALLLGLQPLSEIRSKPSNRLKFAEESIVIGANLLIDLNPVVLDGDLVPTGFRVQLHRFLDDCYLLWQDQCGTVFDQRDDTIDALADRETGWELRDWFVLTFAYATKVIAWLAGLRLPSIKRVRLRSLLVFLKGVGYTLPMLLI